MKAQEKTLNKLNKIYQRLDKYLDIQLQYNKPILLIMSESHNSLAHKMIELIALDILEKKSPNKIELFLEYDQWRYLNDKIANFFYTRLDRGFNAIIQKAKKDNITFHCIDRGINYYLYCRDLLYDTVMFSVVNIFLNSALVVLLIKLMSELLITHLPILFLGCSLFLATTQMLLKFQFTSDQAIKEAKSLKGIERRNHTMVTHICHRFIQNPTNFALIIGAFHSIGLIPELVHKNIFHIVNLCMHQPLEMGDRSPETFYDITIKENSTNVFNFELRESSINQTQKLNNTPYFSEWVLKKSEQDFLDTKAKKFAQSPCALFYQLQQHQLRL